MTVGSSQRDLEGLGAAAAAEAEKQAELL